MHFSDVANSVYIKSRLLDLLLQLNIAIRKWYHTHYLQSVVDMVVLDIRKNVAARNDFVNVVDGCVEATLFSSLSTNQTTQIRYIHVPYSSTHTEGNTYYAFCEPYNYVHIQSML